MKSSFSTRIAAVALVATTLVLPWVLPADSAAEEPAKWDQARVTAIAAKLPEATEQLYTVLYEEGQTGLSPGAMGAGDAYHGFRDTVRLLHSESMHLADRLKQGDGRDQTLHAFERIGELNRDAAEFGRAQFTTNPVVGKFSEVEDLIRQLAPYYGS